MMWARLCGVLVCCVTLGLAGIGQTAFAQSPLERGDLGTTHIHDALAHAAEFGDRSLIASVAENARLTPDRADAVADLATKLRPELADQIQLAASSGQNLATAWSHSSRTMLRGNAANSNSASTRQNADPIPYPGADPEVSYKNLPEFERNFSLQAMRVGAALAQGLSGKGVVVGVIDSGFDQLGNGTVNTEFTGRLDGRSKSFLHWFNSQRICKMANTEDCPSLSPDQFKAAFTQGPADSEDQEGHGTHVAGIIAAGQNGFGMQGVAPGATILSIKSEGQDSGVVKDDFGRVFKIQQLEMCGLAALDKPCEEEDQTDPTILAFGYLSGFSDVRVINGSFGPDPEEKGATTWDIATTAEQKSTSNEAHAVRQSLDAGQIIVMAAGNDRATSPIYAENPSGIGLFPFIQPANETATNSSGALIYDDHGTGLDLSFTSAEELAKAEAADGIDRGRIVVVVALDAYNKLASYSNKCGVAMEWCIAAPGGDQPSDRGILSTIPEKISPGKEYPAPAGYAFYDGTSMAAPNVAGAIAVLIEAYPTFTPAEIVHILFTTAEDLGETGVDTVYGWGLVRLDRALAVGPVGMSGTGIYTVGAGGADATWLVDFTSGGSLRKTGSGTLMVASAATFDEASTVEGGTLTVDGSLTTPQLAVGRDARLSGSGSVVADVNVAGRLTPGNSPGTLFVTGDVTLSSTATTVIEIDGTGTGNGAGNFDRIIVSGSDSEFTAGGTLEPVLRGISAPATNSFTPSLGQGFVFVEAPSVAGSFDALTQPADGLPSGTRFDVLYSPTALALAVTPFSYADLSAVGVGQTANERALGAAIDAARPAAGVRPSDDANTAFNILYSADATDLDSGLPTLTGQIHSEMGTVAVRAVGRFADTLGARQMGMAADRLASRGTPYGAGEAWATVEGTATDVGSANGLAGYDVRATNGAAGADWRPGFGALGFGLSYEYADVSSGATGSGDADTYQGGLYATFGAGPVALALRGGLAYGELSTARTTSLGSYSATASADGHGFGGFAEATAFRAFETPALTLTPSATLGWRGFHRNSVDETGSAFALSLPGQTFEEMQTTVALAVSKRFALDNGLVFEPVASVGWRHDFSDLDEAARLGLLGASFEADGAEIGADAFLGRIDLTAMASDRFAFGASYQAEIRDNLTGHTFSAEASFRF